jgi:hypothetical protein
MMPLIDIVLDASSFASWGSPAVQLMEKEVMLYFRWELCLIINSGWITMLRTGSVSDDSA